LPSDQAATTAVLWTLAWTDFSVLQPQGLHTDLVGNDVWTGERISYNFGKKVAEQLLLLLSLGGFKTHVYFMVMIAPSLFVRLIVTSLF
jgi:hypothetical protein